MLEQAEIINLKDRFMSHWTEDQFAKLVAFTQDEFTTNKVIFTNTFEAIHNTNIAVRKHIEANMTVKFAVSFGKFVSQAIISAMGVNVLQAYQEVRDQKAKRIERTLVADHDWVVLEGVPVFNNEGKVFSLKWDDSKSNVDLLLNGSTIYTKNVSGFGHEYIATEIDHNVFEFL